MRWLKARLRRHEKDEHGAVAVMVAALMVVLLGMGALAVDIGHVAAEKAQLQNGADAIALAVADTCAQSPSTCAAGAPSVASTYANANANDGTSNASAPVIDFSAATVTAGTSTRETNGSTSLTMTLAKAIGIASTPVSATATAAWGYPTRGQSILPLAMNVCEFDLHSSATNPVNQKILTQGGAGHPDCNGRTPSNQIMPGGFAWLTPTDPTTCKLTLGIGDWVQTSTGAAAPSGCIANVFTPSLLGTNVAVPIYDNFQGTGNNTYYHISMWAGFHLLGWSFPSTTKGIWPPPTNENGIYGYFLGFSADPSIFQDLETSSTPQPKEIYVTYLIK